MFLAFSVGLKTLFPPLFPSAFLVGLARAVVEAATLVAVVLVFSAWLPVVLVPLASLALTVVVLIAVVLLTSVALLVARDVNVLLCALVAVLLVVVEVAALVTLEDPPPGLMVPDIGEVSHSSS